MMARSAADPALEELETDLFLQGVFRHYGYDFRDYEPGMIKRRIREIMLAERISTVSRFQEKVLRRRDYLERLVRAFSGNDAPMFSDPAFLVAFREKVVPLLKTYPHIRVWHAGCGVGHDAYSMAICLTEEGIYQRCRIYATDLSAEAVQQASKGSVFPAVAEAAAGNYLASGGSRSLAHYFRKRGNRLVLDPDLKSRIVFSQHDLVADGSFNEFQVIVCRNVIANFNPRLRARVDALLYGSLGRLGVLALGTDESLQSMPHEYCFALLDGASGFYQKLQ